MKQSFAILGLGYFGVTVAKELMRRGNDVMGVDRDEERVNALADEFSHVLVANVTDRQALDELSLDGYDAVVIDVGDSLEASMICTLLAKEQGAHEIWVKAHSDLHYRLLEHLGAHHIVYPERDTGNQVAENLHFNVLVDFIDLGDHQYVVDLKVTQRLSDKYASIESLELDRLDLSLVALKRDGRLLQAPDEDERLEVGDHMVMMGDMDELRHLGKRFF